jgi:hypothetical protein
MLSAQQPQSLFLLLSKADDDDDHMINKEGEKVDYLEREGRIRQAQS